jgi:probable phosphoglycerate mutase
MLDERLRERDFGPWQGLTDTEIEAAYPAEFATWRLTGLADGLPIETPEQVGARALAALVDAATKAGDGTAVVVMHGAAARHAVGALLDWPAAVVRRLSSLDNCHFTDLRHSRLRGWQLHAHNIGAPTHDLGPAVPNADAMVGRSST